MIPSKVMILTMKDERLMLYCLSDKKAYQVKKKKDKFDLTTAVHNQTTA